MERGELESAPKTSHESDALFADSHYPNCIGFQELDVTNGCSIGCLYCGLRHRGRSTRLDITDVVNESTALKGIYLSPNSDPFALDASEATHKILERYLPQGIPVLIITKCEIPQRTIELLSNYAGSVVVKVSLSRLDKELNGYIEPAAATANLRLATMARLADAGLKVGALAMPLFPGIDDEHDALEALIDAYARAGAWFVKAAYVVLRFGPSFKDQAILNQLKLHPRLARSLEAMTETIKVQIGEGNVPPQFARLELYRTLKHLCELRGLHFTACSVLDPPALSFHSHDVPVCSDVWTFLRG
jgi:DNA repair photolyase